MRVDEGQQERPGFTQGTQGPGHLHTRVGSTASRSEARPRCAGWSWICCLSGGARKTLLPDQHPQESAGLASQQSRGLPTVTNSKVIGTPHLHAKIYET